MTRNGMFSGRPLTRGEQIFIAIAVALAAGLSAFLAMTRYPELGAKDFTYPWRAARALLAGQSPYDVIVPSGQYPYESYFPYPLPTAFVAIPVAGLKAAAAGALFIGVTSGALAFVLARQGMWRLIVLASVPMTLTVMLVQWPPLLVVGAAVPLLGFVLAFKPTLGLALFAYRPSWQAAIGVTTVCAIALLLQPTWPLEWWQATRQLSTPHPAPIMLPFGWVGLLGLLCWRRPEARLLAVMTLVPQNLYFYDQLPLMLVAWNAASAALLTALGWIGYGFVKLACADPYFCGPAANRWVIWTIYVPTTAMVLWRGRHEIPFLHRWLSRPSPEDAPGLAAAEAEP